MYQQIYAYIYNIDAQLSEKYWLEFAGKFCFWEKKKKKENLPKVVLSEMRI